MRSAHLLILGHAYAQATGVSLGIVARRAGIHEKVFRRLAQGKGVYSQTLEQAEAWFAANWPDGVAWPDGVPRPTANEPAPPCSGRAA